MIGEEEMIRRRRHRNERLRARDVGWSQRYGSRRVNPTRGQEVFHIYEFDVSGSTTLDNGVTVTVHYGQVGSSGGAAVFDETTSHDERVFRFAQDRQDRKRGLQRHGRRSGRRHRFRWRQLPLVQSRGVAREYLFSGLGAEDALKVVYTSPNFNGLTIGMSYAPEASEKTVQVPAGRPTTRVSRSEHTAVGVSYSTAFMDGGSLSIGMGYEIGRV